MTPHDDAMTGQISRSAAEVYEQFFVPALFGQWPTRVLDLADVAPGDDVLDVGCGTGVLARTAARRPGRTGTTHGLDVNPDMLAIARTAPEPVVWHEAPAEALPFDRATFDRVLSQFAAMFFVDRAAAMREMARVCRPTGTVTVATWAEVATSPGYARMIDLLDRLVGPNCADALRAPFSIGTSDELVGLLDPALEDIDVVQVDGVARFDSIEAWVQTDVRGWTLVDLIDDDHYDRLLTAAETEFTDLLDTDGSVRFAAPALIGIGRPRSGTD